MSNMAIDFGAARQRKERASRKRKPAALKLLLASGDTIGSSEKLRALQERAIHMDMANRRWAELGRWHRILLTMWGETADSYYWRHS